MVTESILAVEGLDCPDCERRLARALRALEGVSEAEVDARRGLARVAHDPSRASRAVLKARVEAAGFRLCPAEGAR